MPTLKYKDPVSGLWVPLITGATSAGGDEVLVANDLPADPTGLELWVDLDDNTPTPGAQLTQSGIMTVAGGVANTPTSGVVTFLVPFAVPPHVVMTPNTSVPGTTVTGVGVTAASAIGFTGWCTRTTTGATSCYWIAVGTVA